MMGYVTRHLQVFLTSLGELVRSPGASIMTVGVIGITLALPALLYLLVQNVESATRDWGGRAQASLFLKTDVSPAEATRLTKELAGRPVIERAELVTADAALAEFKQHSGFGAALQALEQNPLPHSIVVHIGNTAAAPRALAALLAELGALPQVDLVQSDVAWIQRLHALLTLTQRGVAALSVLLALAVIMIISNTIRLAILNRRDEIEIIKLVGGTDAFIRRPFLYTGLLQGLIGAAVALVLIAAARQLLAGPVDHLALQYASGFHLSGLDSHGVAVLLAGGSALGWLASRWSVGRHLAQIEPH